MCFVTPHSGHRAGRVLLWPSSPGREPSLGVWGGNGAGSRAQREPGSAQLLPKRFAAVRPGEPHAFKSYQLCFQGY